VSLLRHEYAVIFPSQQRNGAISARKEMI